MPNALFEPSKWTARHTNFHNQTKTLNIIDQDTDSIHLGLVFDNLQWTCNNILGSMLVYIHLRLERQKKCNKEKYVQYTNSRRLLVLIKMKISKFQP